MSSLVGNKPNQVPTNGDLGTLAFQDSNAVNITGGSVSGDISTTGINIDSNTFVIDSTNNRVGIGTSSPGQKLHIGVNTDSTNYLQISASTTNAYFGVTTTGVYIGSDTATKPLQFYTVNTERMRIDSSGNLGLGVTPSAYETVGGSLYLYGSVITSAASGAATISYNASTNNKYVSTGYASQYYQLNGTHVWRTAASGTAGNAITFTQAMTLNASGYLGIGTTSPATYLVVSNTGNSYEAVRIGDAATLGSKTGIYLRSSTEGAISTASILTFYTGGAGNTERMRIDSSGNVLIGKTSATANGGVLQVSNGITFPATQVAATDANTLDDYEEGTFTPVIIGTTTAGTGTYTLQAGTYVKIGSQVSITATVAWSAHTGTGNMRLTGLPFTSYNNASLEWTNVPEFTNMTIPASSIPWVYIPGNASYIGISTISTITGASSPLAIDTAAGIYGITITYFV